VYSTEIKKKSVAKITPSKELIVLSCSKTVATFDRVVRLVKLTQLSDSVFPLVD